MKYIFLLLIFCGAFFLACGQSNSLIKKSYAFYKISFRGTLQVDDNGRPVNKGIDTLRFLYLEIPGKTAPVVDQLVYKGKMYSAAVYPVEESYVGNRKKDEKRIVIMPGQKNTLWKVDFSPLGSTGTKRKVPVTKKRIFLKGKVGGKSFTHQIDIETELMPDIRG